MRARSRFSFGPAILRMPLVAGVIVLAASPAYGMWPSDPAANLAIGDGGGEQVVPKIAGLPDGSCYIGWFDNGSGNYNVRLQRLDPSGNEMWPHNGILVSDHAQDTWITDWDLVCDSQGDCVLTFSDIRAGTLDVQAYKIAADGSFVWGPDGINLSQNDAFEPTPAVCEASDGDCVVAWARYPDVGDAAMMMQRISPEGTLRFAAGGMPVVAVPGEDPAFPDLVPSLGGDVLLMWVRDISSYMSPRHIRLQCFSPSGTPVWPAAFIALFDAGAVPLGYAPDIQTDGAGGAVCGWHYAAGDMFRSLVQRVSADGVELFPHNGVAVTTDATRHHIDPATSFNVATSEIFVFWNERNYNQTQWGIYAQKISSTGTRAWTGTGLVMQPVNTTYKSYPRTAPVGEGAVCLFTDTRIGFTGDRLIAYRLDAAGAHVWPVRPVQVSTAQSTKARLPLFIDGSGVTRIVWEDGRNGSPDVYAQNVNADGTLGYTLIGVEGAPGPAALTRSVPNPFESSTEIVLVNAALAPSRLAIFAVDGRLVRAETMPAAKNAARLTWTWDGRDGAGRKVPAGVYAYRWMGATGTTSGKVVVCR